MKVIVRGSYLGNITRTIRDRESGEIRLLNYVRLLVDNDVVDIYIPGNSSYDGHKIMDEVILNADVRVRDNRLLFRLVPEV